MTGVQGTATVAPIASGVERVRARSRRRRAIVVSSVLVVLVALVLLGLALGEYPLSPSDIVRTLTGGGSTREDYVIYQVRLPRVVMTVLVGAALAVAGALLQSILRNPLASPDLLGISGGASFVAVVLILVLGVTGPLLAVGAFVGGMLVAALLLTAGARSGGRYRLILAGIGVAFLTTSLTSFVMVRTDLNKAQSALVWLTGSFSATPWWQVATVAAVAVLLLPALLGVVRQLPITQLGSPTATGLGVEGSRVRWAAVLVAVLLTATTCAFVGPISFVALCAPAIARSLQGRGSAAVGTSAAVGAALMIAADLTAQFAFPVRVPAGIVTGGIGAVFLLWLLATSKGRDRL
ncbi:iron chelate uptake ABC transporter family permease subunit [Microbacterium sp. 18062]|uniref:FecCD family ABC transporter permease n=1 Tax=Microbacterium sp. 18062 TaxID=2681410 RepID=UPI001F2B6E7D|nr:iron ABC transporter permease [Microbacterium sp. 18062]